MGKTVKQRKKKQFMYSVDRRKVQQKRKKKLEPRIPCEAIREAWDSRKHTKANLESMGLAFKVRAGGNFRRKLLAPWRCYYYSYNYLVIGCF